MAVDELTVAAPEPLGRPVLRPLTRVLIVAGAARGAQFVEALLFPLVAVSAGASTAAAGGALLAQSLGVSAGALFGGPSVDRYGPRAAGTAGLALSAFAAAVLAIGQPVAVLIAAAAVFGASAATWRLALEAATSHSLAAEEAYQPEDPRVLRERAFTALIWVSNAGALASAAALVAGLPVREALGIQALALLLAAAASVLLLPGRAGRRPSRRRSIEWLREVPWPLWRLALAFTPLTMVMFQGFAGLAHILDDGDYRLMILASAATLVLLPPLAWSRVSHLGGTRVLAFAGGLLGSGIAATAVFEDPIVSTVIWSAGEVALLALTPAIVTGIAPHRSTGTYRSAFAVVQGVAAGVATFVGPVAAGWSVTAFALGSLALAVFGVVAVTLNRRSIEAGLHQPVACPCGALACVCEAGHADCLRAPILVPAAGQPG